jgi:hypothetical protein
LFADGREVWDAQRGAAGEEEGDGEQKGWRRGSAGRWSGGEGGMGRSLGKVALGSVSG